MEKNEFVLNVLTFQEANIPAEELDMEGYSLTVSVWLPDLSHMMDEEITYEFPELWDELELEEIQEGAMIYAGELDKEQLMNQLERMGFRVVSDPGLFRQFQQGPNPNDDPNYRHPHEPGFGDPPQWSDPERDDPRDLSDLDPSDVHYDLNWNEDRKQYDLGVNTRMDVDQLKRDMQRAVEREDYEKAAKLRDVIKKILGEEIKRIKRLL